jgi:hypothetical protein
MPGYSHLDGPNPNRDQPAANSADTGYGVMATFDKFWWRDNYAGIEGVQADRGYDYYEPALRYGWESRAAHSGRSWSDVEPELASGWGAARGASSAKWDDVKHATRHAFERAVHLFQGGKDPDRTNER